MQRIPFLTVVLIVLAASASWAGQLYVASIKAPIWAEPSFQAGQIGVLARGVSVQGIAEKNGWYQVRYNEQTGWMLKMMLLSHKPIAQTSANRQAVETLSQRARRRPSAFASTAAARGFKDKRRRFSDSLKLDYRALEKMESFRVNDGQALEFLKKVQANESIP